MGIAVMVVLALTVLPPIAHAQSYNVIYRFSGGQDGSSPVTGLMINAAGTLYGTAFAGGANGYGTVFQLKSSGSGWTLDPIYSFAGGNDGEGPASRVVQGPDGAFYGSTTAGGGGGCTGSNGYRGCGTIYRLRPPARAPVSVIVDWDSNAIYRFTGREGSYPQGDLTFDSSGNIYGTAVNGGAAGLGTIYSLTQGSGGWDETTLYQARGDGDGQYPWGGVTFDSAGNLYGVFMQNGPHDYGAVFELSPSGSGWTESTVHAFTYQGDNGAWPQGGLISDASGNMYGTTVHSANGGGTIFELTPSGDGWSWDFLYDITSGIDLGPYDKLVIDSQGNLYGTTFGQGQYGLGSVFKLTYSSGGWHYTSLHDFTGGSDGANPMCALAFDANGNLYGTTSGGGNNNNGVIFQITP